MIAYYKELKEKSEVIKEFNTKKAVKSSKLLFLISKAPGALVRQNTVSLSECLYRYICNFASGEMICMFYKMSRVIILMTSHWRRIDVSSDAKVAVILVEEIFYCSVRESGHGFATYINDVMARCKVQKAILHCLSASVYNTRNPRASVSPGGGVDALHAQSITESIIHFNEEVLDSHVVEAFQVGFRRRLPSPGAVYNLLNSMVKMFVYHRTRGLSLNTPYYDYWLSSPSFLSDATFTPGVVHHDFGGSARFSKSLRHHWL